MKASLLRWLGPAAGVLTALALTSGTALAATGTLTLNTGQTLCSATAPFFKFALANETSVPATQSITIQFQQSGGGTIYSITVDSPGVAVVPGDGTTYVYAISPASIATALQGAPYNLSSTVANAIAKNFVVLSTSSVTLPAGGSADNFVLIEWPCPSNPGQVIPEVPMAVVFPLLGIATFGLAYGVRRMRYAGSAARGLAA